MGRLFLIKMGGGSMESWQTVRYAYGCIPRAEKRAIRQMRIAFSGGSPYTFIEPVTAEFVLFSVWNAAKRQENWERVYKIERTTIEIEDIEVEVYLNNQLWFFDVVACAVLGGCSNTTFGRWDNMVCAPINPPWVVT